MTIFCRLTVASTFAIWVALASSVMPVQASAQDFETIPVDGAPDVYIFRHKDLQAIFIVTSAGVIVTDPISHKSAGAAVKYLAEIKKITSNPIKYVIYSHGDLERSGGGQLFKDEGAKFIAHAQAKKVLEKDQGDAIIPDETVEENKPLKITLGGRDVIVKDVGRNYSNDMLVVLLPKEKVLYAADFIPLKTLPSGNMAHSWIPGWEKSLETVYNDADWEKLVLGRRYNGQGLATKADVQGLRDYFAALSAKVKDNVNDCWAIAMSEIRLPAFETWGNYKQDLPGNVERYCYYWTSK